MKTVLRLTTALLLLAFASTGLSGPLVASSCTEGDIQVTPMGLCCPQGGETHLREQCINGQWQWHPDEPFQCGYTAYCAGQQCPPGTICF